MTQCGRHALGSAAIPLREFQSWDDQTAIANLKFEISDLKSTTPFFRDRLSTEVVFGRLSTPPADYTGPAADVKAPKDACQEAATALGNKDLLRQTAALRTIRAALDRLPLPSAT